MKDYKKILEWMRELYPSLNGEDKEKAERYFPELKESGEEKIRKIITLCLEECVHSDIIRDYEKDDAIAWLKKQGEQKSVDKVEPKFKVGDWVTDGVAKCQIHFIDDKQYWYSENCILGSIESVNKRYHLWTIKDAKKGDVLVASDGSIFLFAGAVDCACKYYVALTTNNDLEINREAGGGYWESARSVLPATDEQYKTLFKAMDEAGYEWDAEKEELKKIDEQYSYDTTSENGFMKFVQNQHKSEEQNFDNRELLDLVIKEIGKYSGNDTFKSPWALDSTGIQYPLYFAELGARWQKEQKSSWSEDDEGYLKNVLWSIQKVRDATDDVHELDNMQYAEDWLNSLKERYTWKPSDEQLKILYKYVELLEKQWESVESPGEEDNLCLMPEEPKSILSDEQMKILYKYAEQNSYDGAVLTSLYQDLKKLRRN